MSKSNDYIINFQLNMLIGEYTSNGRLGTWVIQEGQTIFIDLSPLEVVDESLKYINSDIRAATSSAQSITGCKRMCPVVVNPFHGIVMLPYKAPGSDTNIWFNEANIDDTMAEGRKTRVIFKNGDFIVIDARLSAFKSKLHTARRLREITSSRLRFPGKIYIEPKNKIELKKGKNGAYNLKALNHKE